MSRSCTFSTSWRVNGGSKTDLLNFIDSINSHSMYEMEQWSAVSQNGVRAIEIFFYLIKSVTGRRILI
jgi:hypothetical protein